MDGEEDRVSVLKMYCSVPSNESMLVLRKGITCNISTRCSQNRLVRKTMAETLRCMLFSRDKDGATFRHAPMVSTAQYNLPRNIQLLLKHNGLDRSRRRMRRGYMSERKIKESAVRGSLVELQNDNL